MRRISVAISDPLEFSLVEAQRVYRRFELIQPDSRLQVIETGHRIFTYDGPIPVRVGVIYQNASLVRWCGRKFVSFSSQAGAVFIAGLRWRVAGGSKRCAGL